MPSSAPPWSPSYDFSQGGYNGPALKAQLDLLANYLAEQEGALDDAIRADNTLSDGIVRLRNLHAEVKDALAGLNYLEGVAAVATTNQATSGLLTIDGVTLSAGSRVLLTAQTTPTENGIWIAASGAWAQGETAAESDVVTALGGDAYVGTRWLFFGGTSWKRVDGRTWPLPTSQIADGAVTTAKIADGAVTTAKIADANVTAAKLGGSLSSLQTALGISAAMSPVVGSATLALARAAMGPWGDALVTVTGGSAARALADMAGDIRHVLSFGATVTTAAVQAAIDSLPNGGVVFIPNGTHSLGKITVVNSGITIFCQSPSGCVLVPELSAGDFLFDVDLSSGPGAVRPFYFRFTNGSIVGDTATRPMSAFKLKHVYCGGVDNTFIKGVNKALYFSDSYWSNYENLWIEHYTTGISAESVVYPGNQNNFKNVNLFDGSSDDVAVPFDLTAMGNCLFDTCTIGSSDANKVDQMNCWNDNTFVNCRFESIRTDANQAVNVGHRNRFIGCYFAHQDGFGGATTPAKNYIKVSGDDNLFDSIPLSFYGNLITLDVGTKGNEVFFDCDGLTTNPGFSDFGDNTLHFDRRDHSSNGETSSEFAVTNLWTRSTDGATATADGVTAAAHTDVGPFDFGEVIRLHTPAGNRRWYFSLGSIAANEVYSFAIWMKAVSGTETVEIQLDPQETPRQVTVRSDRWIRVYHATSMQGGPFTRRAQITLGALSGGILVTAPQVVYLGTAGAAWPKVYWGGYVPVGAAARKVIKPNHTQQRYSYAIPTYGTYNYGDVIWSLQAAAGGAPGWAYTSTGWKAMANLAP